MCCFKQRNVLKTVLNMSSLLFRQTCILKMRARYVTKTLTFQKQIKLRACDAAQQIGNNETN